MTLEQVLKKRIVRVRGPKWAKDSYLKIDYFGDEVSPTVAFVSSKAQKNLHQEVGSIRLTLQDAFGKKDDWEEYNGKVAFKF